MRRLVRPALRAILEAIDGIEAAVSGKILDDFADDWLLRHGVQRGIEIISEAARRIPMELQATQPDFRGLRSLESAMCFGTNITGFRTPWCGTLSRITFRL